MAAISEIVITSYDKCTLSHAYHGYHDDGNHGEYNKLTSRVDT